MTKLAILDDYQRAALTVADWSSLGPDVEVVVFAERLEQDDLVRALRGFDVVVAMRERTAFPRSVLKQLPDLRMLATTGMANAAIDLDAARELGILVSGTPSGLPSTIEITWALILAVIKGVPSADADVRAGRWQQALPQDLAGRQLGLVGLGRLGAAMVPIARAFSMEVVAWSQNLTDERCAACGVRRCSREELFETSDVISIHLRLSERTQGLVGRAELETMRASAILVNTSRGPIVDEAALVDALSHRHIRGAGLDVYDLEPLPAGHPLTTLDNVVLTPHLGYASEANLAAYYGHVVENIAAWLAGTPKRIISEPTS